MTIIQTILGIVVVGVGVALALGSLGAIPEYRRSIGHARTKARRLGIGSAITGAALVVAGVLLIATV